jgi:glycosyltransferase involved in cell wall biosynthesis
MDIVKHFDKVTLLITHYNRSKSLERLLTLFNTTGVTFQDIVVSDDCSSAAHLNYIKALQEKYNFQLVTTPTNGGLGNNINKGQARVTTEYTLYVQEDFFPLSSFKEHFTDGFDIMEESKDIDTVRFYSYLNYPNLKPYKLGFAEMVFDKWSTNIDKVPLYSDHPHLRRSNFHEKFGKYPENKNPEKTEYDMMIAFLKKKGRGLLFIDYKGVFDQENSASEPSTMNRKFWRNTDNVLLKTAVNIYRHLLFNYRLFVKGS